LNRLAKEVVFVGENRSSHTLMVDAAVGMACSDPAIHAAECVR
jgi:hypothetical protein